MEGTILDRKITHKRLKCEICGKAIFESECPELNICTACASDFPIEGYVYDLIS